MQEPNTTQPIDVADEFNGVFGLLNFTLVFCLVWFFWYLFMHPSGIMKRHIGMHGCSIMVICLCTIVFMSKVADFCFMPEGTLQSSYFFGSGALLPVAYFIIGLFSIHAILWGLLAVLGVTCLDYQSWEESGNAKVPSLIADESAVCAAIYFTSAFFSRCASITWKTRTLKRLRISALVAFSLIISVVMFQQVLTIHAAAFLKGHFYQAMEMGGFVVLAWFLPRSYVHGFLYSIKARGGSLTRICLTVAVGLAMYGGYTLIENLLLGCELAKLQGASFVWSMIFLSITLLQLDFFDREKPAESG